jgi:hypothetical protein
MHYRDGLVGQRQARVQAGDRGVAPPRDLPQVDLGQPRTGEVHPRRHPRRLQLTASPPSATGTCPGMMWNFNSSPYCRTVLRSQAAEFQPSLTSPNAGWISSSAPRRAPAAVGRAGSGWSSVAGRVARSGALRRRRCAGVAGPAADAHLAGDQVDVLSLEAGGPPPRALRGRAQGDGATTDRLACAMGAGSPRADPVITLGWSRRS